MAASGSAGGEPEGNLPHPPQAVLAPPYRVTASRSIQAEHLLDCIPDGYSRLSRASSVHFQEGNDRVLGFLPCYQQDHRTPIITLFVCWLLQVTLAAICMVAVLVLVLFRTRPERDVLIRRSSQAVGLIFLALLLLLCVIPTSLCGYISLRYAEPRRLRACIGMQVTQLIVAASLAGFLVYLLPPKKQINLPLEYLIASTANLLLAVVITVALHYCNVLAQAYRSFLDRLADTVLAAPTGYNTFEPPEGYDTGIITSPARE
ncbi:hypothetical protein NCLIV_028780 [Neospora caninum Liverpool]|uniref:Transmembrane protein n=1 Tax=Neospora caninum (strain Liverpool) TaxID=572307 RepID=F0VH95_NEOCL|nr:hypothetical protein NCLIV_028780 [Neospora caninum Liverpool]CBZ53089.1 hypothetical protein NCLIV_028780 [Neospora caninum Liverpool]CEL67073.1 TPA: hypothetical protein BN1204_028780 [Neospora caninum Liverpool]|eukprot:XP_003883121.1 hypothetical protein NCLIV_028780 [Neospora caninum Liverpool]